MPDGTFGLLNGFRQRIARVESRIEEQEALELKVLWMLTEEERVDGGRKKPSVLGRRSVLHPECFC